MNKTFKTLFTLFLGILFFIPTFTANSANIADDLTKLNNLYKEGAITKEEFSKAKDILFKSESTEEKTETKKSETKKKEKKEVKKSETKKKEKKVVKARTFDEDLSKTFMTLEEVDELGTYKKIEKIPDGMFKIRMSSKAKAKKSKFTVLSYDRSKEPKKSKQKENSSISWGISNNLNAKSPDIIYHKGDIGKEPMILIFGNNPDDVIKKVSKFTPFH